MDLLARYMAGEHVAVTDALDAAGDLPAEQREEALAVADALMARVRDNCLLLAQRLHAMSYRFSVYCDPYEDGGPSDPRTPPDGTLKRDLGNVRALAGPLPVTLEAFWRVVGGVALTGCHPDFPDMLDPLVIFPPAVILDELRGGVDLRDDSLLEVPLSPDDYHKDNVSGGAPYGLLLPQAGFDFELRNERLPAPRFVPYLRRVILDCGGFAALTWDEAARGKVPVQALTRDLVPF